RFTRASSGLITSPFLLTGTTNFHLNQCKQDFKLFTGFRDNLYLHNFILIVDNLKQSLRVY
ncbi:hypothetical protein Angca_001208, partial [Angiostrongylus cantonensis]